ncbi:hypothetical protein [Streptomyces collinus]|uniref:hypothetical protein n=1 Tax=Streptomyces collinus TaxID=42684 RepID=UPI0033CE4A6B
MDPVTVTTGCGVAVPLLRLGYLWLSARSFRRRVELEERRTQDQHQRLMDVVSCLPPGSEVTQHLPNGERLTIKVSHEAA